jgi:pseudaminic acid cytidylyltransferase
VARLHVARLRSDSMNAAIIPARGGSKRVPRKNIRDFCGKPMIAWSISAALESGCFDHVIVSTDDVEIAEVAKEWGADVPFMRPRRLADDHTATRPVVNHAIREIAAHHGMPELVCCLYATAPFVRASDLEQGLITLATSGADFAFTVSSFGYPIQRALRITRDGRIAMLHPENRAARAQDLEATYHDAGQFYWGRTQAFLDDMPMFSQASVPILLPRYRVQDIDTPEDWRHAELLFEALQ